MNQKIVLLIIVSSLLCVQLSSEHSFLVPVYCQTLNDTNNVQDFSPPPYTEWNRTYDGAYTEARTSVIQTQDGGYTVIGIISVVPDDTDFLLIKTNSDGIIQWNKTYG